MLRLVLPLSVLAALVSAFFLYATKHDTRAIEARVKAREREIEKAVSDIAVLKAERAHLARPERIEPLARAYGLMPPSAQQIVRTEASAPRKGNTGALPEASGGGETHR